MLNAYKKKVNEISSKERICVYNQYPGNYNNFQDMQNDLARIRDMEFTHIWINPFYATCQINPITPTKVNCPYAMQNHQKLNPEYGKHFDEVKAYTQEAKRLGLIPLFDFVGRHVAIDHPFVQGDASLKEKGIDTTRWFKRHSNGNLVINGMDDKLNPTSDDPWSDVAEFDYSDPEILNEIFEHFWKPFIDFNIETLGFQGARLDAVGRISRSAHEMILTYIDNVCKKHHQKPACLIAETVGTRFVDKDMVVKGLVTHTMNSVFWMPGPEGHGKHTYDLWKQDDNFNEKVKRTLQTAGPTLGHSGSHDEPRYIQILKDAGVTDNTILKQRMLEKIMVSAFSSDGGHILAYGDEYGIHEQVNLFQRKIVDIKNDLLFDLNKEIKEINQLVKALPKPTAPEKAQRIFLSQHPEIVAFLIEQDANSPFLIIGNTQSLQKPFQLEMNTFNELVEKAKIKPAHIYLCGAIENLIPENSQHCLVSTFHIKNERAKLSLSFH